MTIERSAFGTLPDGRDVTSFTVTNASGLRMRCMDYGATLTGFMAPDREGRLAELTLRYDDLTRYVEGHPFFGSTVGRVANRIARGRFALHDRTIEIPPNEGRNLLHSGPGGFHAQLWRAETFERGGHAGVLFQFVSPEGDQGFPGQVIVSVSLSLSEENELHLEYHAESDAPTPLNLTNHAYWNVAGAPDVRRLNGVNVPSADSRGGAVGEHELLIHASEYLELDDEAIPTGRVLPVAGTPFDFTHTKPIGRDISEAGGYDLCYVLDAGKPERTEHGFAGELRAAAFVRDPSSGRTMEVLTTSPAIQLYTGEKLAEATDQYGRAFHRNDALCLETQYHPDAVNHADFPSIILEPGETFQHRTVHRFSVT